MSLPKLYHLMILWIGNGTGLPDALLHVHAGMAILLLVRLMTNRSLGSFIPFIIVVIAEFSNEMMDYLNYGLRWHDTIADAGNTLLWPLVISMAVRLKAVMARSKLNFNLSYTVNER